MASPFLVLSLPCALRTFHLDDQVIAPGDLLSSIVIGGLHWWLSGKESACTAGDAGDAGWIPGSGRSPGGGHGNPTPVFLFGEFHEQRSLVHGVTKSQT